MYLANEQDERDEVGDGYGANEGARYLASQSRHSHPNPARCGCRGTGYWLTQLDVWHCCGIHGKGAPHPEDAGWGGVSFQTDTFRKAYKAYAQSAMDNGYGGDAACFNADTGRAPTIEARLILAEEIANDQYKAMRRERHDAKLASIRANPAAFAKVNDDDCAEEEA
jgi:hypothetical protein